MTYYFETYGCQMNAAESAASKRLLSERGWSESGTADSADMVVINTCSVRQTAENRVLGRLGNYTAMKRERAFTLVVMGCMAERVGDCLKKDYPAVDYVVGNLQKQRLGDIADAVEVASPVCLKQPLANDGRGSPFYKGEEPPSLRLDERATTLTYEFAPLSYTPGTFSSYVLIMHGCNNYCTYCIVPYLRGHEISRPVDEILSEVDALLKAGVKEITLLGQNVNSYHSGGTDFAALLRLISSFITNHCPLTTNHYLPWVRFMSSHPKDLTADVIRAIAECPIVCHHIHLPVQHGSTRILKAMNRRYTREDYLALVAAIRAAIPDVSLTTDIMVGFPGETEEDFDAVLSLMDEVRYENAFMYYYNVREGTPAAKMPEQVPLEVKKARLQQVIDRQLEITAQVMTERVGSIETALVEGVSRDDPSEMLARTARDERVAFKGGTSLVGQFVTVRLTALNGHTFKGERVTYEKA